MITAIKHNSKDDKIKKKNTSRATMTALTRKTITATMTTIIGETTIAKMIVKATTPTLHQQQ